MRLKDSKKTKKQMIEELAEPRQRIAELKHSEIKRELAEEELRKSVAKIRAFLAAIPDLMFRLNKDGVFLEFTPAEGLSVWGPSKEFLGKSIHDVLDKNIAKKFMRCVKRTIETGETQILKYQLIHKGKTYHNEARIVTSGVEEVLVIVRDFTKQRQAERMAATDPLTNVYNRGKFSELLGQEIKRVKRYDKSFSIVLLDIDHFKKINDSYGHDVGDYVLRRVTELIRENIRGLDMLARYGGEEFVIILPETDLSGAEVVAERVRKAIECAFFDEVGHITVSAGVSDFIEGDNMKSLVKKADNALYVAKNDGRNRVSVH